MFLNERLGMRLTLADSGDSIEDANFEEEKAEAQLLRLYTFIEWVKDVLQITPPELDELPQTSTESKTNLVSSLVNWMKDKLHLSHNEEFTEEQKKIYRTDTTFNYYDRIFDAAINRAIQLTEESYEKMLYKDVLKYGFFELQIARDNYRELCSDSDQLNLRLIKRFIEVQVLLLAPICPHICEYVYQFLHPGTSIMNAKWPVAGKVDQSLIDACNHIMDTAHDFRLRLKTYSTQQTGGKGKGGAAAGKTQPPLTPTHATIFIARSYPSWQTFVLNELKQLYHANNRSVPDSKQLAVHFKDRPEIEKKYQKKLMPFVIYSKDLLEKSGDIQALDQHLSFDEYEVLSSNQDYFRRTLNVEQIEFRLTDGNDTDATLAVNLEDIIPGKPLVHFRHEASVSIRLLNRQVHTPHFEWTLSVMDGDTVEKLEARLRRNADRPLRLAKNIRWYYFQNWEFHSRVLPNLATPYQGLVELDNKQQVLKIDLRHGTLNFNDVDIGNVLVYFVE